MSDSAYSPRFGDGTSRGWSIPGNSGQLRGSGGAGFGVLDALYAILLFFAVFDTARTYTPLPMAVGYLKEFSLVALAMICISFGSLRARRNHWLLLYFLIVVLVGLIGFRFNANDIILLEKYCQLPLGIFVFSQYESMTGKPIKSLVESFSIMACALVFINIFGYFVPNPILSIHLQKAGLATYVQRVSLGQPSLVSFIFNTTISYEAVFYKGKGSFARLTILSVGLVIMVPGSGIAAMILNIFIIFLLNLFGPKNAHKGFIRWVLAFMSLGVSGLIIVFMRFGKLMAVFFNLISIKLLTLIGMHADPSLGMRDDKYNLAITGRQWYDFLIGNGAFSFHIGESLENSIRTLFVAFGIVGVVSFICFLAKEAFWGLTGFGNRKRLLALLNVVNFGIFSISQSALFVFIIVIPFALMYAYCRSDERMSEPEEISGKT
jgi:hypothetical protein